MRQPCLAELAGGLACAMRITLKSCKLSMSLLLSNLRSNTLKQPGHRPLAVPPDTLSWCGLLQV